MSIREEMYEKGFVRAGGQKVALFMRHWDKTCPPPEIGRFRRFNSGSASGGGRGGRKYSSIDLFGGHLQLIYDSKQPEKLVNFLKYRFYERNPDPPMGLRKAFTHLLTQHGLLNNEKGIYTIPVPT